MRKALLLLPLLFVLGCKAPAPDTPGAPLPSDPPKVTVLKYTQLGAAANNTAAHTLAALCPVPPAVPSMDAAACSTTAVYIRTAARTFDQIAMEASSADAWPTMRVKIAGIGAASAISVVVPNPTLQAQINAVVGLVTQILGVK